MGKGRLMTKPNMKLELGDIMQDKLFDKYFVLVELPDEDGYWTVFDLWDGRFNHYHGSFMENTRSSIVKVA